MPKKSNDPNRFYVYTLINPLNNEVFYVGKGSGNRITMHRKHDRNNSYKVAVIDQIKSAGFEVIEKIVKSGLDEQSAYEFEKELIKSIGKDKLTNHSSGVSSSREISKILLARFIPFDEWVQKNNPSEFAIKMYHLVLNELKIGAEHGFQTTVTAFKRRDGRDYKLLTYGESKCLHKGKKHPWL